MRAQEKSTEIHTLFTEMDHGYVNYVTFNWWGTNVPLFSRKGILLKSNSYVKLVQGNTASGK